MQANKIPTTESMIEQRAPAARTELGAWRRGLCAVATALLCCGLLLGCEGSLPEENTSQQATVPQESETTPPTEAPTVPESEAATEAPTEDDGVTETTAPEETTAPTEEDTIPADPDYYKNEVKLFNRSTMLCANELVGEFTSVAFKDGGLTLVDGATEGTFVSEEINLGGSFKNLLTSWNASSKEGTVEVSVSVKLADGGYTGWYSWGIWSADRKSSGSKSMEDQHGKVDIDTLTLKDECQGTVRFRIHIKQTGEQAPVVYNVTLACDKKESALKAPAETSKKLDVPYRRQGDVPEIGGSICSATSLSMVLLYYGEELDVADVAWGVRDYGAKKFGNWSYNVAYAGELGYNAYIDYYDLDAIKYAISMDTPIVCSIRVKTGQLSASGFPSYYTNGHLICVVGFEERNGKKWLLINDPGHPDVKAILESDFEAVYRGVSYVVQTRPNHSAP